eukprot:COSAG01_NODE_9041_length_2572_cov_4.925192_1_plen_83_part_00
MQPAQSGPIPRLTVRSLCTVHAKKPIRPVHATGATAHCMGIPYRSREAKSLTPPAGLLFLPPALQGGAGVADTSATMPRHRG